jgi:hypothetical protein
MRHPTRYGPWSIALPALLASAATLVIPGAGTGSTPAGAVLLAVGALALLAGHTWGLLVLVPAHIAIAGRLWPQVAIAGTGDALPIAALAIVLVTMIPTVALSAMAMPGIVATLFPEQSPRRRSLLVAAGALCLAAALVVPALTARSARRVERAEATASGPTPSASSTRSAGAGSPRE